MKQNLAPLLIAISLLTATPSAACALFIPNVPAMRKSAEVILDGSIVRRLEDSERKGPDLDISIGGGDPTNEAYLFKIDRVLRNRNGGRLSETIQVETYFIDASENHCRQDLGFAPPEGLKVRIMLRLDPKTRSFHRLIWWEDLSRIGQP